MKRNILFFCLALFVLPAFSQGFSNFTVEGALSPAVIHHAKGDAPSSIEVIVSSAVDIRNVKFKYRLLSGCNLSPDINADFSVPQRVLVSKNDGSSKEWLLHVKQLTPSALPLQLSFSAANPSAFNNQLKGWAALGIDQSKPTVIRFGNKGVSFWVAFNEPAKLLKYQLKAVSREPVVFDGEFIVEGSADGKKWKVIKEFDEHNPMDADGNYEHELSPATRFVRWTYVARNKLNLNLNHIIVTAE